MDTLLTPDILENFGFIDKGQCSFETFNNMNYWVKNGVCLFYNTPIQEGYGNDFYIGYAELREGKYIAVAFRWINTVEVLIQIYESITGKLLTKI